MDDNDQPIDLKAEVRNIFAMEKKSATAQGIEENITAAARQRDRTSFGGTPNAPDIVIGLLQTMKLKVALGLALAQANQETGQKDPNSPHP